MLLRADGDAQGPAEADDAPRPRAIWMEALTVPELLITLPGAAVAALAAPAGGARPVLVLPGFVTGDVTTAPLRAFLRSLGHRPFGWGLGLNVGVADHIAGGLDRLIQELAHRHGSTIDIVGWSAGGLLGRLLAQHRSELVGQVISLGSPIRLSTGDSNIGMLQELAGKLFVPIPPRIDVDQIPVPSTTMWTAHDGIVPGPPLSADPRAERRVRRSARHAHRARHEPVGDVRDRRPLGPAARRLATLHPPPASELVVPVPRTGALRCIS